MSCQQNDLYVCVKDCGCIIELARGCNCDAPLSCCGEAMTKVVFKTADQGKEKHVPVIEKIEGGVKVKVGAVPHPMEADHSIEFIEIRADGEIQRKYLKPGQAPEAVFKTDAASLEAIEFCNKHGLWSGK